jgi:tetratricopeptide (TPR) repeat protein/predicted Ser/Thr protein kinase
MATRCPSCRTDNPDTANFCNNCATSLHDTQTQGPALAATRTIESHAWELTTGITFGGRYQIIELLGRGGMGRVYRALDTKTREEVALKLIRPDIASDKKTLERFVNEITLAHKVSHRNIGRMYHLGEDQGIHFITMEYVPGEDLKSFIRRSRRLDIGTTVAIAKQVCGGLSEAHAAGIVHRDLKPSNIMIDKEGNAKILDFGIARAVGTQGVTADGIIIGTPEYMSPEQVEGKDSDRRSDIYSFGVILFEMVTGRLPFAADTPFAVAFKQQSEKPPRPEDLNPQTPPQLGDIIIKCLEKDRGKRYQSTEEVCSDLGQVEETILTAPTPAPWAKPTTRKTRPVAGLPFPWRKALIPALVFLGIMAAGVVVREIIPKAKGSVHTVAVVGFENLTGEASYEYLKKAIPNLLITSLEQSRYLDVMSWERLNDLAGQRDGGTSTASEEDLWFEICRREGIEAIVLGSFTKADNLFATDAKVYDVPTKNLLKSVGSRGEGVGSILRTQIDELSQEISKGVGISERAAAKGTVPITQVTTASMDAYESFLKGQEDFERYYFEDARQSLEQAVQKDPDFALAHFYLARVYQNLADAPRGTKALEQFKKLSKTGTAKGKDGLYVAALSRLMEKDTEGYVKGLKDVIRADPRDKRALVDLAWFYKNEKKYAEAIPLFDKALKIDPAFGYALNLLAYTHAEMGEIEKALKMFDRYAAAQPGEANPLDSMGDLYFLTGKFETARSKYEQALAIRPQFPSAWKLAYLHAMDGDFGQAIKWADHLLANAQTDGLRADGHQWKGFYFSLMGRLSEALAELDTAAALARSSGNIGLADTAMRDALWICYDWGRVDLCRTYLQKRLAYLAEKKQGTPNLNRIYELLYTGLLDIKAGATAEARKKLEDILSLSTTVGEKEKINNLQASNHLKREILFAEGSYEEALKVFREMPPIKVDLAMYMTVQQKNLPLVDDFAARVFMKRGEKDKAIAEYERLVSPEAGAREKALAHPFNRIRLAALYEAKGDLDRAVEQYAAALKIWRDADPDLPEVAAARKKLSVLKAKTARPKGAAVDAFYPSPFYVAPGGFFIP